MQLAGRSLAASRDSRSLPRVVRVLLPALLALGACTDAPLVSGPARPSAPVDPVMSFYPDAGVLTSSRDTCPGYNEAPDLAAVFWEQSDSALVDPDSIWAADSAKVENPDHWVDLMIIDPATGAEMFSRRCEVEYNRCVARCARMSGMGKAALARKALCFGGCMNRWAICQRREREREQDEAGRGPYQCGTRYMLVYDPDQPCDDVGGGGSGGGGGDTGTGSGSGCRTEYVVIEVNDGSGWRTYWEGYATVCD